MVAETGVTWRKPTQAGGEHANPKALEMAMTGSRYGLKYLDKHWMEYHSWSPEDESYPTVWHLPSEIGTAVHVAQRMICYQLWWAPDFSSSVTMRFERRLNNVVNASFTAHCSLLVDLLLQVAGHFGPYLILFRNKFDFSARVNSFWFSRLFCLIFYVSIFLVSAAAAVCSLWSPAEAEWMLFEPISAT